MAGLRVSIKGLRFRTSDGKLSLAKKLEILRKRLMNNSVIRVRAGENGNLLGLMREREPRRPLRLDIEPIAGAKDPSLDQIDLNAYAISPGIKIKKFSYLFLKPPQRAVFEEENAALQVLHEIKKEG